MKKMVTFMAFFSALTFNSTSTCGQSLFFVEQDTYIEQNQKPAPYAWIWASHDAAKSQFGVWSFGLTSQSWGELLIGPNYDVPLKKGFLQLGVGAGIESHPNMLRSAAYGFSVLDLNQDSTTKGDLSYFVYGEYGVSGYWYLGYATYNVTKTIGFGVHSQYGGTWGPRLQWANSKFMVWATTGRNIEVGSNTALIGLRAYF